jgi:hypothetical protein
VVGNDARITGGPTGNVVINIVQAISLPPITIDKGPHLKDNMFVALLSMMSLELIMVGFIVLSQGMIDTLTDGRSTWWSHCCAGSSLGWRKE